MTTRTDNGRINILFSTNSGYAMPMTVSITSIFENTKNDPVTVHVFYSTLTEDQKEKLNSLALQYGQTISLVHIDDHYFDDVPVLRWSKETYYRLLISELLPSDVSRVLYLDCDTVVNKDIRALYDMDLGDKSLAMRQEDQSAESFSKRLRLASGMYFQAGVILFDMAKVRHVLSYESSIETIRQIGDRLIAVDQDVVNVMFDGKIASLSKEFNDSDITNFGGERARRTDRLFNRVDQKEIDGTTVFHFATGKPWNNLYSGSCEHVWYAYLKLSPYKGLYDVRYSSLKYKLLRTGLFKTLFFEYIHLTPAINKFALSIFPKRAYENIRQFYRNHIK